MKDLAIRVEGISKCYSRGKRNSSQAMHEFLEDAMLSPWRLISSTFRQPSSKDNGNGSTHEQYFWALKDISFEVKRGEVVAIMGNNGAGKSVLLKILSRITKPTKGYAEIHGRVSAMLEAGAGFHRDLTGRENIYLNGIILGMKTSEINRKFEEIVSFAGVEEFLNTPIKRYSTGMKGRLAFAIAVQLKPEILIIDELLAVEDKVFQEKSFLKIKEIARSGITVLFVSHNQRAISSLCQQAILLDKGRIIIQGDTDLVLSHYKNQSV